MLGSKYLCFFSLILVSACKNSGKHEFINSAASENIKTVQVQEILYEEQQDHVTSFGSLSFEEQVVILNEVEGLIESIHVQEGEQVRRGQLLVKLKNIQLELNKKKVLSLLQAGKAAFNSAKMSYAVGIQNIEAKLLTIEKNKLQLAIQEAKLAREREKLLDQEVLLNLDGLSQQKFTDMQLSFTSNKQVLAAAKIDAEIASIGYRDSDLAKLGYSVAADPEKRREQLIAANSRNLKAELAMAESQLETRIQELDAVNILLANLEVRSPINGLVAIQKLSKGQFMQARSSLMTILGQKNIYVLFPLQESLVERVSLGQELAVDIPALHLELEAKISSINPLVDSSSGNFMVRALVEPSANKQIKQGMYAGVKLNLANLKRRIIIPKSSLLDKFNSAASVFVVRKNYLVRLAVKLGLDFEDNRVELLDGLEEGEQLVITSSLNLRAGMQVRIADD